MHLYFTGVSGGNPVVTFEKSKDSIESTIKTFDEVVGKIQNHEFTAGTKNKKICQNCDMRYYCDPIGK